jgi:hypothetical protein
MSLMLPIDFPWTSQPTALQLNLLSGSLPRAVAAGAIIALIIAVFATTVNHGLAAWGSALVGVVILLINHVHSRHSGPGASLATLNFLDSIAGGILLGGIAVAVLHGRLQVFGWTLGALGSVLVSAVLSGERTAGPHAAHGIMIWPAVDSPPTWLIATVLVLVGIGTVANVRTTQVERRSIELPMAPILAGVVLIMVAVSSADWLGRHGNSAIGIVMTVTGTVCSAVVAALLLPRRDGTLVLLAVPLAAIGSAFVQSWLSARTAVPLVALIALGLVLGFRRPAPLAGLLILATVAGYGVLTGGHHTHVLQTWVLAAVLATTAGYCFGSAAPRYNPTRVLGVTVIYVPSVVLALRDQANHGDFATATVAPGQLSICPLPPTNSPGPYWAALAITAGCAIGLIALQRWRPPTVRPAGPGPSTHPAPLEGP